MVSIIRPRAPRRSLAVRAWLSLLVAAWLSACSDDAPPPGSAPTVSADRAGWYTEPTLVTITAADPGASIVWIGYRWDLDDACATGATYHAPLDVPAGDGALHTLHMCARSSEGEEAVAHAAMGVDTTAPGLTLDRSGWYREATLVTVSASDAESGISWVRTLWDSEDDPCVLGAVLAGAIEVPESNAALHVLSACAENGAGTVARTQGTLGVDTTGGARYYFSSTRGDDSRTAEQAQDPATPWQTTARATEVFPSLQPGDVLLFARGEVFAGPLVVGASGSPSLPIVVSAFGLGPRPIISGFSTVSAWTDAGGGVFAAPVVAESALNMVTVDGESTAKGRWPNGAYLTVDSHVGTTSITDDDLPAEPDWTGAEVVIRKHHWIIDRNPITDHTGTTIAYASTSTYEAMDGYGYFIQNHVAALDRPGEWAHDGATLHMYFGSEGPTGHVVRAATTDTLISMRYRHDVLFDDLSVEGANDRAYDIASSSGITIQDGVIAFSGNHAVFGGQNWGQPSDHLRLTGTLIHDTHNVAIHLADEFTNARIDGNTILDTAMLVGMGGDADGASIAISTWQTAGLIVEHNTIRDTGYIGVAFSGDRVEVRRNLIDGYCSVKDDGAGIYTYRHSPSDPVSVGRRVEGNIVVNGVGAVAGSTHEHGYASGIYMDGYTTGVAIVGNTVARNDFNGILINSNAGGSIEGNLAYDNRNGLYLNNWSATHRSLQDLSVRNNVLFSRLPAQPTLVYADRSEDGMDPTFSSDENYFVRPLDDLFVFTDARPGGTQAYTLAGWQTIYGLDPGSHRSPVTLAPYTLGALIGADLVSNGAFDSSSSGFSCWNDAGSCQRTWVDGKLDGGTLQIAYGSSVSTVATLLSTPIGAVSSDRTYILRFTHQGTMDRPTSFAVYLRQLGAPYRFLTPVRYTAVSASRTENEVLFAAPAADDDAALVFELQQADGGLWLDNVSLHEADVTMTDPDARFRFEHNASETDKVVPLDATYVTVDGTTVSGSLTLPPYASTVLIRQ